MVGVDDIGGYLAIELGSLVQQFEQLAADIAEQQRSRGIETDALHSLRQTNPAATPLDDHEEPPGWSRTTPRRRRATRRR